MTERIALRRTQTCEARAGRRVGQQAMVGRSSVHTLWIALSRNSPDAASQIHTPVFQFLETCHSLQKGLLRESRCKHDALSRPN